MYLRKLKTAVVCAIAIAGVMASLVIQHRAEIKIREKDEAWRQQDNQLVALAVEHERVSNVVTQAKSSPPDEQQRELKKLRIEVEWLGKQINELETNLESGRRARIALFASTHPTRQNIVNNERRWRPVRSRTLQVSTRQSSIILQIIKTNSRRTSTSLLLICKKSTCL